MNALTHMLLAKLLYQKVKEDFGFSLCKTKFIWGSIKPDLIKSPISHFKDEKIDYFFDQWEKVCNINPDREIEGFSEELGVVIHHLSDYFCAAHNDKYLKREIWPHLKYENRLHKVAKRLDQKFFQLSHADFSQVSFYEILEYKHKLYLQIPLATLNDLKSAFEICLISVEKLFMKSCVTMSYQLS